MKSIQKIIRKFKNRNDMNRLTQLLFIFAFGAIAQYMVFGHLLPCSFYLIKP